MSAGVGTAPPRERIIEAVLLLVERGGVPEASLRKVSGESGVNIGSVRHYYDSHENLLLAAADEIGARMQRRLEDRVPTADPPVPAAPPEHAARIRRICDALVPDGPDGRRELVVLTEFLTAARRMEVFRPVALQMGRDMRAVLRAAIDPIGLTEPDLEVERLVALIAGITSEMVQPHGAPGRAVLRDVLRLHIDELVDRRS